MFKKPILLSLIIFLFFMSFTSFIKNKTRNLEKQIFKLEKEISVLQKYLNDAETDYTYLSSPEQLNNKLFNLNSEQYTTFERERLFLSIDEFLNYKVKEAKYHIKNKTYEKKK